MFSNLEILVGGCLFGFIISAIIVATIVNKVQNSKAKSRYRKACRMYKKAKKISEYAELTALASNYEGKK